TRRSSDLDTEGRDGDVPLGIRGSGFEVRGSRFEVDDEPERLESRRYVRVGDADAEHACDARGAQRQRERRARRRIAIDRRSERRRPAPLLPPGRAAPDGPPPRPRSRPPLPTPRPPPPPA